jgi:hypothetical protein
LEFLTVTEPIPPESETGVVRHPERRREERAVRQRETAPARRRGEEERKLFRRGRGVMEGCSFDVFWREMNKNPSGLILSGCFLRLRAKTSPPVSS